MANQCLRKLIFAGFSFKPIDFCLLLAPSGALIAIPTCGKYHRLSDRTGRIDRMVVMVIRTDRSDRTTRTYMTDRTVRTDKSDRNARTDRPNIET